jgi:uncharacterized membrane protein
VAGSIERGDRLGLHPVHAILLASTIPLSLGALLTDWAYASTYHIRWTNFASWLVAGGLVFAGFTLLWAAIDLLRADRRARSLLYLLLVLGTFVLGLLNSLIHAKDAWAAMPEGLILSVIVFLLALAANWAAHSTFRLGERT